MIEWLWPGGDKFGVRPVYQALETDNVGFAARLFGPSMLNGYIESRVTAMKYLL